MRCQNSNYYVTQTNESHTSRELTIVATPWREEAREVVDAAPLQPDACYAQINTNASTFKLVNW